jgi:NAD(P)-dependent dehydrogenase (short-subunit alcohol dehydrogenase family)
MDIKSEKLQAHRLAGKTVIVTGGASGIGKAICVQFAKEGARVVVLDIERCPREGGPDVMKLMQEARQVQGLVIPHINTKDENNQDGSYFKFVQGDVLDKVSIDAAIAAATGATTIDGREGRLDVLVNNAAKLSGGHSLLDTTEEEWDNFMSINVKGAFLCTQAAVNQFLRQEPRGIDGIRGRVVNVTSQHGKVAADSNIAYGCSKAALDYMTRQVAVDYIDRGIIVNAVAPGRILSGRIGSRMRSASNSSTKIMTCDNHNREELAPSEVESLVASESRTPFSRLGRLGAPVDVAKAAAFLASDDASYIVGETLLVDGGYIAS